jgi:hypothetical protein
VQRLAIFLTIAAVLSFLGGCTGVYGSTVRDPYDKHDPGCIQQDDYMQKHPVSALLGGGP